MAIGLSRDYFEEIMQDIKEVDWAIKTLKERLDERDKKIYELSKKVLEKEMDKITILEHKINPQWNYTIG